MVNSNPRDLFDTQSYYLKNSIKDAEFVTVSDKPFSYWFQSVKKVYLLNICSIILFTFLSWLAHFIMPSSLCFIFWAVSVSEELMMTVFFPSVSRKFRLSFRQMLVAVPAQAAFLLAAVWLSHSIAGTAALYGQSFLWLLGATILTVLIMAKNRYYSASMFRRRSA